MGLRIWALSLLLCLLALFASGCASSHTDADYAGLFGGSFFPETPPFLSGPIAVLLTNNTGFSAHVQMESSSLSPKPEVMAGELLGRGNLLLFAPDPSQFPDKRSRKAGLSFVWDVKENRGYLLSDALQGYAPIGFNVRYTNVTATAGSSPPQKVSGHPGREELVTITSNEGAVARFQVWQATDLKNFPLHVASATNTPPRLTLTLSKLRFEPPPAELFTPPNSFTRYASPDVMMSELAMRQHNLKQPSGTPAWTEPEAPGTQPPPRPR